MPVVPKNVGKAERSRGPSLCILGSKGLREEQRGAGLAAEAALGLCWEVGHDSCRPKIVKL